jgi:hypothetical protein
MQIINTDWIITTDADCVVNKTGYWPWTITFSFMMLPWLPSGNVYLWQFIFTSFPAIGYSKFTRRYHWEFWY